MGAGAGGGGAGGGCGGVQATASGICAMSLVKREVAVMVAFTSRSPWLVNKRCTMNPEKKNSRMPHDEVARLIIFIE